MPDATQVRDELRSWLDASWDPELSLVEWRRQLVDAGWACPTWSREWWGRELPSWAGDLVGEELARVGAPGPAEGVGMFLAAPTILEHGDDATRQLLRPTITGEITWCQLFSEPGAGSDLAGLTTRAERDGDTWVVTGQKVWNTSAHHADYGLLLARSDWDAPKHRGITYFALPMLQPGVEVRPLRQMNGHASFNEVFLDEAQVPAANVIGGVGDGWTVALTTLAHERRLAVHRASSAGPGPSGRAQREAAAEQAVAAAPYVWYPQRAGRPDLLVQQATSMGRNLDPVVRQAIARTFTLGQVARWTAGRAMAARAQGRPPGPEGSIGKLASSHIARTASATHALIAGPSALTTGPGSPLGGTVAEILVSVPAISIAGGTDEIQRNILAERILGLPREPDDTRTLPFRDVRRNPTGAADPGSTA